MNDNMLLVFAILAAVGGVLIARWALSRGVEKPAQQPSQAAILGMLGIAALGIFLAIAYRPGAIDPLGPSMPMEEPVDPIEPSPEPIEPSPEPIEPDPEPIEPDPPLEPTGPPRPSVPLDQQEPGGTTRIEFPWPPPRPSATTRVSCLAEPATNRSGEQQSLESQTVLLAEVDYRWSRVFNQVGHLERRYFYLPWEPGFVMISRLEQTDRDGIALTGTARWEADVHFEYASPLDFLRSIFIPIEGHFRIVVFVVSVEAFSYGEPVLRADAISWFADGYENLPWSIGRLLVTERVRCTLLIYEFNVTDIDRVTSVSFPSQIGMDQHVANLNMGTFLW